MCALVHQVHVLVYMQRYTANELVPLVMKSCVTFQMIAHVRISAPGACSANELVPLVMKACVTFQMVTHEMFTSQTLEHSQYWHSVKVTCSCVCIVQVCVCVPCNH